MKCIWQHTTAPEFNYVELSRSVLRCVMLCDAIKSVNQALIYRAPSALVPFTTCDLVPYTACALVPYTTCALLPGTTCVLFPCTNLFPYHVLRMILFHGPIYFATIIPIYFAKLIPIYCSTINTFIPRTSVVLYYPPLVTLYHLVLVYVQLVCI